MVSQPPPLKWGPAGLDPGMYSCALARWWCRPGSGGVGPRGFWALWKGREGRSRSMGDGGWVSLLLCQPGKAH